VEIAEEAATVASTAKEAERRTGPIRIEDLFRLEDGPGEQVPLASDIGRLSLTGASRTKVVVK